MAPEIRRRHGDEVAAAGDRFLRHGRANIANPVPASKYFDPRSTCRRHQGVASGLAGDACHRPESTRHRRRRLGRLRPRQPAVGRPGASRAAAGGGRLGAQFLAAPAGRLLPPDLRPALLAAVRRSSRRPRPRDAPSSGRAAGSLAARASINGLLYIRGQHRRLRRLGGRHGATGWSYREVLPYFKRSERYEGGESDYHGASGELGVSDLRNDHPVLRGLAGGRPARPATRQPPTSTARTEYGVGRYQLTICAAAGAASAATAFLASGAPPARTSSSCRARMRTRVLVRGRRARWAIECAVGGRATRTIRAAARGDPRRRRPPVAADAAALRHRPGRAAQRHGIAGARSMRPRSAQTSGPLPGARHRQAEGAPVAQRRCAQSPEAGRDGRCTGCCAIAGR